jgi:hypothetical protein
LSDSSRSRSLKGDRTFPLDLNSAGGPLDRYRLEDTLVDILLKTPMTFVQLLADTMAQLVSAGFPLLFFAGRRSRSRRPQS